MSKQRKTRVPHKDGGIQGSRGWSKRIVWEETVRHLMLRCPVVVSAPGVFFWAGEHSVLDGGLAVIQQVPLRVHVGLEPFGTAHDENFLFFDTSSSSPYDDIPTNVFRADTNRAIPCDLNSQERETNIKKVESVANLLYADLMKLSKESHSDQRYRIRIVSELRPGGGVNWSGAFSVALVTAILLEINPTFRKDIQALQDNNIFHWGHKTLADLVAEPSGWFNRINRWAWILEAVFHEGSASGYGTLGSLAPSILPIAYRRMVSKRFEGHFPRSVLKKNERFDTIAPKVLYQRLTKALGPDSKGHLGYQALAFRDFFSKGTAVDETGMDWHILFGLIDTCYPKATGEKIRTANEKRDKQLYEAAGELAGYPFGTGLNLDETLFGLTACSKRSDDTSRGIFSKYTHFTLSADATSVSRHIKRLLVDGDEHAATDLLECLETIHGGLEHLGLSWPCGHFVKGTLSRMFGDHLSKCVAVKATGGAGGGFMFFAIAGRSGQAEINQINKELQLWNKKSGESRRNNPPPFVIWHSKQTFPSKDKEKAAPGVCVELVFDEANVPWGRSVSNIPKGQAFVFPHEGEPKQEEEIYLSQMLKRRCPVVVKIGERHYLFLQREDVPEAEDPTLRRAAVKLYIKFFSPKKSIN